MRSITPEELETLLAAVNRRAPMGEQDYWLIVLAAHTAHLRQQFLTEPCRDAGLRP